MELGQLFVEVSGKQMAAMELMMPPTMREQQTIEASFSSLTTLSPFINVSRNLPNGGNFMLKEIKETDLFCEYYAKWITVYKKGR